MDVGERVRQARVVARMSLRELAERVGVSAQAISKYERGLDQPGSAVVLRLAQALGVSVEFLLRPVEVGTIRPDFRKRARLAAKLQASLIERIRERLERYVQVERLVYGRCVPTALPEGFPIPVSDMSAVESAADRLRKEWQLGTDAIENMTELLEDREFKILSLDAPDEFDGCTFRAEVDGCNLLVIVVREGIPGDRQRFNLAHELAHCALDPTGELNVEKAAHRFAGAFLCPAQTARQELGNHRHRLDVRELMLLKRKYGLSMRAWVHRAQDLGVISADRASEMYRLFNARGWTREEPVQSPVESASRMERLVHRCLAEGLVTRSRAAELLGRTVWELKAPDENTADVLPAAVCR